MAPSGAKNVRKVISGGLEPPTFCVLDRCDDRYTTRSMVKSTKFSRTTISGTNSGDCPLRHRLRGKIEMEHMKIEVISKMSMSGT
uniref:Uncharacterized protein n=1 Tax=Ascaris lumbricoides TaxID=6252 RepID=A0A0M3I106_ASCLU